jgi:RNA polymerase sigma factor (sigma-70 family)
MSARIPGVSHRRSFERLYREHFAFVWAAARGFGVPPAALEDATQDVFITAYRKLDGLRTDTSPRGWLYGVTRRVASRYRRGMARRARRRAAYANEPRLASAEPQAGHDARQWLRRALRELDPLQRETFLMAELLGMSGPEIAEQQGVPVNTVYSRVRLARKQLRRSSGPEPVHEHLAEIRRADAPTTEQRQRVWVAVVPALEGLTEGLGTIASASIGAKTMGWIGGALVLAGATALGLTRTQREPERAIPTQRASTAELPQEDLAAAEPLEPTAIEPEHPSEPAAPTSSARGTKVRANEPEPEPEPGLAEELELLDRAQVALDRGAAREALAWVDLHARRFRTGQLADLREATRVGALCRLGNTEEARRVHAALVHAFPSSSVVRKEKLECW